MAPDREHELSPSCAHHSDQGEGSAGRHSPLQETSLVRRFHRKEALTLAERKKKSRTAHPSVKTRWIADRAKLQRDLRICSMSPNVRRWARAAESACSA